MPSRTDESRIFEKSVNCVEAINGAVADVEAARFQWHIGAIASFQAILHILSELRNPLFNAPDRQRALRALQMSRIIRENNTAKAWQVVKNMIDKAVSEHSLSPISQTQTLNQYISQPPATSTLTLGTAPTSNTNILTAMPGMHKFGFPNQSMPYNQQALPSQPQLTTMPSQPDILRSMQNFQDRAPIWDDINLNNINNIIGDLQPSTDAVPEFDFVSGTMQFAERTLRPDQTRVSGATPSTTRTSLWPCRCKMATFPNGQEEYEIRQKTMWRFLPLLSLRTAWLHALARLDALLCSLAW